MRTRHVTVGVDGTITAVRALDRAADEAALRGVGLEIVHVVADLDEAGPVLASAAARVRARRPGTAVTTVPVQGHSAGALAERGRRAALTVVGCRDLGGILGAVVGSVSARLAAHAPGPLLVVRGDSPMNSHDEIILALDDATDAGTAAYAFQEAELRRARLRIPPFTRHQPLLPMASHRADGRSTARPAWVAALADLGERHPTVRADAPQPGSAPVRALVDATRTADLVVVAAGPTTHGPGRHLGPVARELLHRSHCPVLIVPAGQETA
ncbi:universal stress protein [Streptomyces sp. NPDC008159]|uniref:universal stress protein n=1 Tax=Streptomyces sp. NPDC008159 TaxID=3364817 RepID=UPI0036E4BBE2